MNTSLKDDIRKVITIAALLVALGMLAITLAIGLPGKSIMSLRESIILGALTGVPAAIAFYLSIGRESVGGFPVAAVIAIGYSAADVIMLQNHNMLAMVTFIISSVMCIVVQLICNRLDEHARR